MANAFEPKKTVPLQQKTPQPELASPSTDGLPLPPPKPKRKQYSVYVSIDTMERVKRVARQRGVTAGDVLEACVKKTLEQMEE